MKQNSIPKKNHDKLRSCVYCNRTRIRRSGYSFFKFPLDKSDLLKKWLDSMGIKNWTPNKSSLLCSDHFEQTCLRKLAGKYLTLKDGSIPTIFKTECSNNIKSKFDEIKFIDNSKFNLLQEASCNELRNQIQTHSEDENLDTLSISDKTGIVNLDHHYHITPSTLLKKLVQSQEKLKSKQLIITNQKRELAQLRTYIMGLEETITELKHQLLVSEKCLN